MSTLRDRAEQAAKKWCICADDYKRRDRVDPTCRCDAIAEALEDFAAVERKEIVAMLRDLKNQGLVRACSPPGCPWKHWCEAYEDAWRSAALIAENG